ncbi:MAG: hypothetical protein FJ125_11090, partial [Deltaproteobacteria bacterium]|nr:hypothetical protein [Deltaproteobacteria bacterium]
MTSIEPPTSLLRPEDLPRVPLLDATPYLEDQTALVRVAGELGYLYLPGLLSGTLVDAVRAFVRGYAEAAGWVAPAPGNPPVFQAISGAGLDGRGWDDPCWVELQRL